MTTVIIVIEPLLALNPHVLVGEKVNSFNAAWMYMNVGSYTGAWVASPGSHLWRKHSPSLSEKMLCMRPEDALYETWLFKGGLHSGKLILNQ